MAAAAVHGERLCVCVTKRARVQKNDIYSRALYWRINAGICILNIEIIMRFLRIALSVRARV